MSIVSPEKLQANFGIDGMVQVTAGQGGLPRIQITNPHAQAEIYLAGAYLTHYQPVGQQPVLFLSKNSYFEAGKPLRGGVPICWPWFGLHHAKPQELPLHGFARLMEWTLVAVGEKPDGSTLVELRLQSKPETRTQWPHDFEMYYTVTVGKQLICELTLNNPSNQEITFEEALHTYLRVSDVRQIQIRGLEGAVFVDKTQQMVRKVQPQEPLTITGKVDRVYVSHTAVCEVYDPAWQRTLRISKEHSNTTVVWNPWVENAKTMPDFGDDEWVDMVCIESANALDNPVKLPGGQRHTIRASVEVVKP